MCGCIRCVLQVHVDEERIRTTLAEPRTFAPFATFECVFFRSKGFLERPTQLLDNCASIAHIPMAIVHGRQDIVCRPSGAWKLHKLLPLSKIEFVANAGHSDSEPGTEAGLVRATEEMKSIV
jgi:proline iminopeptidase